MRSHNLQLAVALAATLVPRVAAAQHEAHLGSASQAPAEMMQCAQVQPVVDSVITGAMTRLESARQSNSPADMRAAVDQLGATLRDIRAQLAPCSAAAADSAMGHTMPGMQPSPGAPAPAAPMDHSKMPMGGTPAATPGVATGAKPTSPAAHMDHSKMPMGRAQAAQSGPTGGAKPAAPMDHSKTPMGSDAQTGKVTDPVNGLLVDPDTAPKTTYQGQTYYFSSEESRKEFLANPAKYSKKSRG